MPETQTHQHTQFTRLLTIWDRPNAKKMTNADRRHQREYLDKVEQTWLKCAGKPLKTFAIAIADNSESMTIAAKEDRRLARQYGIMPRMATSANSKVKQEEVDDVMEAILILRSLRST